MPIKVAHITLSMDAGGIENFILNFARSIDRKLFELTVGCLDHGGVLLNDIEKLGHKSFVLSRRPGLDWRLVLRLGRIFREGGYQIIHTHNQASHFYAGLAAKLAGVPCLITTEHSRHYIDLKLRRRLEKRFLNFLTSAWVTVSDELADMAVETDGLPRSDITVIPNGIDADRFSLRESPEHASCLIDLRRSLEIPRDIKVAIIIARLHPIKNHAMLLRAISSSDKLKDQLLVLIVGEGELRRDLTNLSHELGLSRCVRFLGLRKDIPQLLALSDLFVLCSQTEGLPLSLLEAMAAKVPVLITRAANRAGLITDGTTGKIVDNSPQALRGGMLEMIGRWEHSLALAEKAAYLVQESYSLESMMSRYIELYLNGLQKDQPLACSRWGNTYFHS